MVNGKFIEENVENGCNVEKINLIKNLCLMEEIQISFEKKCYFG